MITALIVDDEKHARKALSGLIENHFPEIKLVGDATSVKEAIQVISHQRPKILFLDIELGNETAFDLLRKVDTGEMEIIFTTAHESYALQAIKFAAVDYLLKPVSKEDLRQALERMERRTLKLKLHDLLDLFRYNLDHTSLRTKKIVLNSDHLEVVPINKIIRCESDGNYTSFFLTDKRTIVVTQTMKQFEDLLEKYDFCRIHHKHLINMAHVRGYMRGDGGVAIMNDETRLEVSRRKKEEFIKRFVENV